MNCGSIISCVRCIGDIAVDQGLELAFDSLTPTDPKAQKPLNECQSTIGKAITKLMATKSKALAKCWASLPQARTPAAIGFSADCFAAAVPSCAAAVATLPNLMDCVGCVSEHDIDCADAAAIPLFKSYPGTCNPHR